MMGSKKPEEQRSGETFDPMAIKSGSEALQISQQHRNEVKPWWQSLKWCRIYR